MGFIRMIRAIGVGVVIVAAAGAALAAPQPAAAAPFTVNDTGDAGDASPGNGVCATAGAVCTLRAAIQEANALAGADTISFSLGAGYPTIQPGSELPAIGSDITIDGNTGGATKVQLDGSLAGALDNGLITGTSGVLTVRNMVINRFGDAGINTFFSATSTTVEGSLLGTDTSGTVDLGNGGYGIRIQGGSATIGGDTAAERNVISGNDFQGISLDPSAGAVTIQGNYIGTDITGTVDLGNTSQGIASDATSLIIGGTGSGEGNVISGNGAQGILAGAPGGITGIYGNKVGTDVTGTTDVGNGTSGIHISAGTAYIGRYAVASFGLENIIAFNDAEGVLVSNATTVAAIDINSIHDNGGLGIDLNWDGPHAIDTQDTDSGPNGLQNQPLILSASSSGGMTTISGYTTGVPNVPVLVVFYSSPSCDASGYGEGTTYIHHAEPIPPAEGGTREFSVTFPYTIPVGHVVTATTASGAGYLLTSEFSQCPLATNDYDGDGYKDPQRLLHEGPTNTNTAFDNCPELYNPAQVNTDGNFFDNSPPYAASSDDKTRPNSDNRGDDCEVDPDNDILYNLCEGTPTHTSCAGFPQNCPTGTPPFVYASPDTDGDLYLDGAECTLGTDPASAVSKPTPAMCAAYLGVAASTDTDGDKLLDRIEFCHYNTDRTLIDTDGDASAAALGGNRDGCEAASVNGDRSVNAGDQLLLASEITRIPPPAKLTSFDINKDGGVNAGDQLVMATLISPPGQCPVTP
jgi:CSLREA domain-containing protein